MQAKWGGAVRVKLTVDPHEGVAYKIECRLVGRW